MTSFWIGLGAGIVVTAIVARLVMARGFRAHTVRLRAAERRASSAERMAEIGAMTGGLAHEIKNPLSTIGLNAQLLDEALEDLDADADEKRRLRLRLATLSREVERLRGILTDFLSYAGELRIERSEADLNEVAEELVDFFHPQAEAHGVRLRAELAEGSMHAWLDVPHVKQATMNLMLNATQAMSAHSGETRDLILRTERTEDADGNAAVALHVIDTGPGLDDEKLARVFSPYFTTTSGGTGLGLPTARRLVEAHGGQIDVHTEPGRGSDFVMTFPVEVPRDESSPPSGQTIGFQETT